MNKRIYLDPTPEIRRIGKIACGYKGNKFQLVIGSYPSRLDSYWDGGSRDYYSFVRYDSGKAMALGSNHPIFEANKPRELKELPIGCLLVKHTIFCGKDLGITIYSNTEDINNRLLPENPTDITENEKTVLEHTYGYKNSYAGKKHNRFRLARQKTGITRESWLTAKETLIEKKLLTKAGAITNKGRNAIA